MNYTLANYEQDKRIANYVFKRNFNGHHLREDLIQVALVELWELRKRGNYDDYVASACDIARKKMISYLRKEKRHRCDYMSDPLGEDMELCDIVCCPKYNPQQHLDYRELVKSIIPLPLRFDIRDRRIISMHLKHYTQKEIARRVGVSQTYVSFAVQKFRETARALLDGGAE